VTVAAIVDPAVQLPGITAQQLMRAIPALFSG